ncbi:MAG: transglycosylase SLT domain-containing protein [Gemmatimonadales bacterium]
MMKRTTLDRILGTAISLVGGGVLVGLGLSGSRLLEAGPAVPVAAEHANAEIVRLSGMVDELKGTLSVNQLQLERLGAVFQYSAAYRIPADLAGQIYDAAVAEGLHPSLGYQLVKVESGFRRTARSPRSAIGYTQVRIQTAKELDPTITERALLDPATNLRIGFRILKRLLRQFDQDLALALRAYNMGPTAAVMSMVDSTADARAGLYAERVMRGLKRSD